MTIENLLLRVMKATGPVDNYIAFISAETGGTLCRTRKTGILKDRETVIPMEPPVEIEQ